MATDKGIDVQRYPTAISATDLHELVEVLRGKVGQKAPRYARWLLDLAHAELERRALADAGDLREPSMPSFNGASWAGPDFADALLASDVLLRVFEDKPAVREMLRKLDGIVRAWAAHRLRQM